MSIIEKVMSYSIQAQRHIKALAESYGDEEDIYLHLRKYIMCKFLLEEEDMETDELMLLSVKSISRMLEVNPDELEKMDAEGCQKTNSVIDKKVMLLLSLEKKLKIQFAEDRTAALTTIKELSREVFRLKN